MDAANRRIYSWLVLVRKAVRTFWETRSPAATAFAWGSNVNCRNVANGR